MTHDEAINLINNAKTESEMITGYNYLIEKEQNTNAMLALGHIYFNKKDIENAIIYYKKASDYHNPLGFTMLGFIYYYGRGVDKDYELAFRYFTKGALEHEYHSTLKLSDMYKFGYYLNQDYNYALTLLEPLYNEGMAMYLKKEYKNNPLFDVEMRYADSFKEGNGNKQDLARALDYYTFAYNGFIHQMDYDKYDTYNKLKYCLKNIDSLKKELNRIERTEYDILDFVFDKKFKFSFEQSESTVVLRFGFNNPEIFIYPEASRVLNIENVVFTFNNISNFNKIDYDELRPIDYVFKDKTLRLYDEESTVMHFEFKSFTSNIKIYPDFYDLIDLLEYGNVNLIFSDHDESIKWIEKGKLEYNGKVYKGIDDFILHEEELKKKFINVEEIR